MKSVKKVATVFALASLSVWGQRSGTAVDQQKLQDAASKGFQLPVDMTVRESASVQAVMLPYNVCRKVFGGEVADHYAAVELIVANSNLAASLIIHSVYIDYSHWLLSGSPQAMQAWLNIPQSPEIPNQDANTTMTKPNQVASVEYRIVRGEALDAQPWTWRNVTMRSLELVGALATSAEFSFKEKGFIKLISAFTGDAVPGAKTFWPDSTIAQLDRISDFGFHTNKVISKQSGDILVAFFPIDRFLTPEIKKIFQESPAAFFVPAEGLSDAKLQNKIRGLLESVLQGTPSAPLAKASFGQLMSDNLARAILQGVSMNNIKIVVQGEMAMDVDKISARADSVSFDPAADWTKAGDITADIQGALLTNGKIVIDEAKTLGIDDPAVDQSSSTSEHLHFTVHLTKAVPAGTVLNIHVTKTKDGSSVDSNKIKFTVPAH